MHTPGPWEINEVDPKTREVGYQTELQWVPIASVTGDGEYNRRANARLIAAAPEMLSALKTAVWLLNDIKTNLEYVIDKVEGKTERTRA